MNTVTAAIKMSLFPPPPPPTYCIIKHHILGIHKTEEKKHKPTENTFTHL